jgi:hypothetical protein
VLDRKLVEVVQADAVNNLLVKLYFIDFVKVIIF